MQGVTGDLFDRTLLRSSMWQLPTHSAPAAVARYEELMAHNIESAGPHAPVLKIEVLSMTRLVGGSSGTIFSRRIKPFVKPRLMRCKPGGHLAQSDVLPHELNPESLPAFHAGAYVLGHKCSSQTLSGRTATFARGIPENTFYAAGCTHTADGFQDFVVRS
jgi:hypothetical protein